MKGLLANAENKRAEYANDLVEVNHYLGKLEARSEGQTEQQKTMLREMQELVSKVDKVIKGKIKTRTTTTLDPPKK